MEGEDGCGVGDMSRRLSGFLAVNLVGVIGILIAYFWLFPYSSFGEALGAAIGLIVFSGIVALVVGFVFGAVRQGAFTNGFLWVYAFVMPATIVLFIYGAYNV